MIVLPPTSHVLRSLLKPTPGLCASLVLRFRRFLRWFKRAGKSARTYLNAVAVAVRAMLEMLAQAINRDTVNTAAGPSPSPDVVDTASLGHATATTTTAPVLVTAAMIDAGASRGVIIRGARPHPVIEYPTYLAGRRVSYFVESINADTGDAEISTPRPELARVFEVYDLAVSNHLGWTHPCDRPKSCTECSLARMIAPMLAVYLVREELSTCSVRVAALFELLKRVMSADASALSDEGDVKAACQKLTVLGNDVYEALRCVLSGEDPCSVTIS